MAEALVFPRQDITIDQYASELGIYAAVFDPTPVSFAIGEHYKILWDGEPWNCQVYDGSAVIPGAVYVGDASAFNLTGNGEPFVLVVSAENVMSAISLNDAEPSQHNLAIYRVTEGEPEQEGIVLKDRNGNDVVYYGIETVTFDTTTEGKQQVFTKGEAVEGLEIVPDFSEGDMAVNAPAGALVKSAIVKRPEDMYFATYMSEDGTAKLFKKPVMRGDTAADVAASGMINTPTKESTVQYVYRFAGWATTPNGGINENALVNMTEDRTVYANFDAILQTYPISYYDGDVLLCSESLTYGTIPNYIPTKEGYNFIGWEPALEPVSGQAEYHAQWEKAVVIVASGTCGDNVSWTIDDNGELRIFGTGPMTTSFQTGAPWGSYASSVMSVVVEEGVTTVAAYMCYSCKNLVSAVLADSVTEIGANAFCELAKLASVTIGNGVTKIGSYAFKQCTELTNITIPAAVTDIGSCAFYNCTNLATATFENTSGWTAAGTALDVSDPATAATYLKSTYKWEKWTRS